MTLCFDAESLEGHVSNQDGLDAMRECFAAEAAGKTRLPHRIDTPTGKVKLDKNRQAIADNYLTEVAKADDGHLYNKVIKVVSGVNQTLGIPEADFLKLGVAGRDNPDCK